MKRRGWILALVVVAILPWAADRLRNGSERCELDGVETAPAYRTVIVEADDTAHPFCGVRCAQLWLARHPAPPREIRVTDCATGRELAADDAWFVRSYGTWGDGAPDAIRVFARRADAEQHAEAYGGEMLLASDRPFKRRSDADAQKRE